MTDFRDVIARAAGLMTCTCGVCMPNVDDYASADAILAMPEMQAIRALLLNMVENNAVGWWDFGGTEAGRTYLRRRGAPESVIAWVVGDE